MKLDVQNYKQLITRFVFSTGIFTVVLCALLWQQSELFFEQQQILLVERLATQLRSSVRSTALFLQNIVHVSSEPERKKLLDEAQYHIKKIKELQQMIVSNEASNSKTRFFNFLFRKDPELVRKLSKYIFETSKFVESIRNSEKVDLYLLTSTLRIFLEDIIDPLDSLTSHNSLLHLEILDRVKQMQTASLALIFLLFVGMGLYIILPTKRLLETYRNIQEEFFKKNQMQKEELMISGRKLQNERKLLESVLDSISDAILFFKNGKLAMHNLSAVKLFPGSEESISLEAWNQLAGFCDADTWQVVPIEKSPLIQARSGQSVSGKIFGIKSVHLEPKHVIVSARPVFDEKTTDPRGVVISFVDVTERVKYETKLKEAKQEAETASRSKSEFLANISHEIRSPMNAILGYADMLLMPMQTQGMREKNIHIIRKNSRMLMNLIDDILDISRIEAGREQELVKSKVNLCEVISDAQSLIFPKAQEKNLVFNIVCEGQIPKFIHTDVTRLRQILINILGNAVKFTERGEIRLTIRYKADINLIEFMVSDTGCGIPKDAIEKLFLPFSQVDPKAARRFGGTGIGLALSRRLARALGGDLTLLTTTPSVGSTFVATLHAGEICEADLVENIVLSHVPPSDELFLPSSGLEGIKILVIEDSPENRDLFACYLKTAGAKVSTASSGEEGVKKALHHCFDLVFTDIQMPGTDGYQTLSKLRENNFHFPIIALTAHAMKQEQERCFQAGFNDYLIKPVNAPTLVETAKKWASKNLALVNLDHLLDKERILSSPSQIQDILKRFSKSIAEEVGEMKKACEQGALENLKHIAHRLKGTASNCGFSELSKETWHLEEIIQSNSPDSKNLISCIERLNLIGEKSVEEFDRLLRRTA